MKYFLAKKTIEGRTVLEKWSKVTVTSWPVYVSTRIVLRAEESKGNFTHVAADCTVVICRVFEGW